MMSYFVTVATLVLLAPFFTGLIKSIKMWLLLRRPVSPLQPYQHAAKLLHKEVVLSEEASWVTRFGPYLVLTPILAALFMLPALTPNGFAFDWVDAFSLTGLLALSTFFLMLIGLDQASGFGGLGASREAFISALVEPAMIMTLFVVSLISGHLDLNAATAQLNTHFPEQYSASMLLTGLSFFILLIAENGRIPVDNPETHLELTMVHEAMILDLSGWHLALIETASSLKFTLFASLFVMLFLPFSQQLPLYFALPILLGKLLLVALVVAWIEVNTAKLRLFKVPNLLAVALLMSFLALILFYLEGAA